MQINEKDQYDEKGIIGAPVNNDGNQYEIKENSFNNNDSEVIEINNIANEKEEIDKILPNIDERKNYVAEKNIDFSVILKKKWWSLFLKRTFDVFASFFGLIILSPIFIIVAIIIATTSRGGVFFKQERVGKNGKIFKIIKFRTMTKNAESVGMRITVGKDIRITKVGRFLRATKIDELPQLFNVLFGEMSLVGARPEVSKYVAMYSDYEKNILRIRPGITELSSIVFKDESSELARAESPEYAYINEIMPIKLEYNLDYLSKLGLFYDIKLIFKTLIAIAKD